MNGKIAIFLLLFFVCGNIQAQQQDSLINIKYKAAREALASERYDDAKSLYIALLDCNLPRTTRANILNEVGVCYKNLGEYTRAEKSLEEALGLTRTRNKDAVRLNLSNLYLISGSYEKAIKCLNEITAEKHKYDKLINLSHAYFRRGDKGDTGTALSYIEECVAAADSAANKESYYIALQNRGYIYWSLDSFHKADKDLETALRHTPSDKNIYYTTKANLAMVKAAIADYTSALEYIESVLSWQKSYLKETHPDYIISLRKRAEILLLMKEKERACEAFRQYYNAKKNFVVREFPTLTEQRRLDFWASKKPLISQIFQLRETDTELLYEVALLRRHIALIGKNNIENLSQELSNTPAKLRKSLNSETAAIEFICYYDNEQKDTVYAALLMTKKRPVKYIHLFGGKEFHGYKLNRFLDLKSTVCSAKEKNKNIIYQDTTLAKKIWEPILDEMPASVSRIYFAPDGLLQMLAIEYMPHPELESYTIHRLTSTSNLCKVKHKNKGKKSRDYLVIGGVNYNKYSAENDTTGETNHAAYDYLIEQYGSVSFTQLKGTELEADSIRQIVATEAGDSAIYTSEAYLKQNMGNYSVVHLATHGYSAAVNVGRTPFVMRDSLVADYSLLASGVVLAGANIAGDNTNVEDGLLSSREICELNLSNVELVILSACQTAQGVVSDEGPAGVVRGLKKAGAKTIIATLWPVNDNATMIFMNAFYNAWFLSGCSKQEAIKIAQRTVKEYSKPSQPRRARAILSHKNETNETVVKPYAQPRYWAPFILIDDI